MKIFVCVIVFLSIFLALINANGVDRRKEINNAIETSAITDAKSVTIFSEPDDNIGTENLSKSRESGERIRVQLIHEPRKPERYNQPITVHVHSAEERHEPDPLTIRLIKHHSRPAPQPQTIRVVKEQSYTPRRRYNNGLDNDKLIQIIAAATADDDDDDNDYRSGSIGNYRINSRRGYTLPTPQRSSGGYPKGYSYSGGSGPGYAETYARGYSGGFEGYSRASG